jgi:hypothetical protein
MAAEAKQTTFKQAAQRWHEAHQSGWTNAAYAAEVLSSLERYAFPIIGNVDVGAIDRDAVLRVLEQKLRGEDGTFWTVHSQTADRTRNRIEKTLDFAVMRGWRGGDNPARWKGYLSQALPAPRKLAPVQHLDAMAYGELPKLMAALAADQTVAAQAARFVHHDGGKARRSHQGNLGQRDRSRRGRVDDSGIADEGKARASRPALGNGD